MIYLIGSLKNIAVPMVANELRAHGFDVFDDWYSPGPEADDRWQAYERVRGRSYAEALQGEHAKNVFAFDLAHLEKADTVVLVLPAGKSAHLELGWAVGKGKRTFILLDEQPTRYDVMYAFANGVAETFNALLEMLKPPPPFVSRSVERRLAIQRATRPQDQEKEQVAA